MREEAVVASTERQTPGPVFEPATSNIRNKSLSTSTDMDTKYTAFWDVTQCSVVDRGRHFGGIFCVHLQGRLKTAAVSQKTNVTRTDLAGGYRADSAAVISLCYDTPVYTGQCCGSVVRLGTEHGVL
jgi:hypothetical protein